MRFVPFLLMAAVAGCASSPTAEEAARIEDYFTRGSQYYSAGRYPQAFDQARRALDLEPDSGRLNLLAGRSLLMQRSLNSVAASQSYLETAVEELDSYKAPYALAEFHFRYGSLLTDFAKREHDDLMLFPDADPDFHARRLRENDKRVATAREHFTDAEKLLEDVREEVPENLDALELLGQVRSLRGDDVGALEALAAALEILITSRDYKNYVLGTDGQLSVEEERRLRQDLDRDIQREVALHYLTSGLHRRLGDVLSEERAYDQILALVPVESGARYSRGAVRYELGRIAEAAADMRAFVATTEMGTDSAQVQNAVRIVREFEAMQSGAGRPVSGP